MLQSLPHFLLLYKNCYILIIAQKYEHKSRVTAHTAFPPHFSVFLFWDTLINSPWNLEYE